MGQRHILWGVWGGCSSDSVRWVIVRGVSWLSGCESTCSCRGWPLWPAPVAFLRPFLSLTLWHSFACCSQARVLPSTSYLPPRHKRSHEEDDEMETQPHKQKDQLTGTCGCRADGHGGRLCSRSSVLTPGSGRRPLFTRGSRCHRGLWPRRHQTARDRIPGSAHHPPRVPPPPGAELPPAWGEGACMPGEGTPSPGAGGGLELLPASAVPWNLVHRSTRSGRSSK